MEDLKKLVESRTGVPPGEQRLLFEAKQLVDGKMLSDYCIRNNSTLFLVMRLLGGAERPPQPPVRKIDSSVPRSKEDCMITYTDGNNVKMPCGHTISPDGLIDYSCNEILTNRKREVRCCLCNKVWDINTIKKYGGATVQEVQVLQKCMSLNFCRKDSKISECPGCHNFCERLKETDRCVVCRICSKKKGKAFNFCWDCKKEWIGNPTNKECGNAKCSVQEILEKLRSCPETEIGYIKGLMVPSLRACPSCGSLIEHGGSCKHMKCIICSKKFCFVCLRIRDGDLWPCGSYNTRCNVAPRQTAIPCRS